MKKALLIVGIALASFLVGFVALTFKMPSVAPQRAEQARHYVDSLVAARSGVDATDSLQTSGETIADSLQADSSGDGLADSARQQIAVAALEKAAAEGSLPMLRDSLLRVTKHVNALMAENQTLRQKLDQIRNDAAPKASPEDIASLTATLAKLDDEQLRPILQDVNGEVLEQLYRGASGRTQARLMQAMPADRAASFVQKLVQGTDAATSSARSTPEKTTPSKAAGTQ